MKVYDIGEQVWWPAGDLLDCRSGIVTSVEYTARNGAVQKHVYKVETSDGKEVEKDYEDISSTKGDIIHSIIGTLQLRRQELIADLNNLDAMLSTWTKRYSALKEENNE